MKIHIGFQWRTLLQLEKETKGGKIKSKFNLTHIRSYILCIMNTILNANQ